MLAIRNALCRYVPTVVRTNARHAAAAGENICSKQILLRNLTLAAAPPQQEQQKQPEQQKQEQEVNVYFVRSSGEKLKAKGKVGDTLLDVVINNDVDLDGFGACEGTLTCSTCHLIFKTDDYNKLPNKPGDEELDMLDLAYDLTDTSRLGCQIILTADMEGLEVSVPATINDARAA